MSATRSALGRRPRSPAQDAGHSFGVLLLQAAIRWNDPAADWAVKLGPFEDDPHRYGQVRALVGDFVGLGRDVVTPRRLPHATEELGWDGFTHLRRIQRNRA